MAIVFVNVYQFGHHTKYKSLPLSLSDWNDMVVEPHNSTYLYDVVYVYLLYDVVCAYLMVAKSQQICFLSLSILHLCPSHP
jgi:hypothetical protein